MGNPDGRVYFEGRPVDAILLPDGSVAYLLEWPSGARQDSDGLTAGDLVPHSGFADPLRTPTRSSVRIKR